MSAAVRGVNEAVAFEQWLAQNPRKDTRLAKYSGEADFVLRGWYDQGMSNRTYVCFECRTSYRDEFGKRRVCATCGKDCRCLDWRARIPKAGNVKGWARLFERYQKLRSQISN